MEQRVFTTEGLAKLKEELDFLKNKKRQEVAMRIKQAKEFGDLSENAEYQEAKDEQGYVESKIIELEHALKTAVIAEDKKTKNVVSVGCEVTVLKDEKQFRFHIVGSTEADPAKGRISLESPLGKALLERRIGEEVEVNLPAGRAVYRILQVR
jgi:transcription elongation factor GreA